MLNNTQVLTFLIFMFKHQYPFVFKKVKNKAQVDDSVQLIICILTQKMIVSK